MPVYISFIARLKHMQINHLDFSTTGTIHYPLISFFLNDQSPTNLCRKFTQETVPSPPAEPTENNGGASAVPVAEAAPVAVAEEVEAEKTPPAVLEAKPKPRSNLFSIGWCLLGGSSHLVSS